MHRKFIALIVSAAIAITGISASQAKAADTHDILGGLAAIAIIGAAVNQYNKKKKEERARSVTRQYDNYYDRPQRKRHHVQPLPKNVARYDLPQRCLTRVNGYSNNHPLLSEQCLQRHYKHARYLPSSCKVGFWNGNRVQQAYEPRCLRQQGYRVVHFR